MPASSCSHRVPLVNASSGASSRAGIRASSRAGIRLALGVAALLFLAGCASTTAPVVYGPGGSAAKADRVRGDTEECRRLAESAVGVNGQAPQKIAVGSARRGASQFVDQAVESLVEGSRNAWQKARGAGAGAMAGSAVAVALNWNEPDAVYREYVDLCMKDRGHKVLGWR
jgi:hypothetical protein